MRAADTDREVAVEQLSAALSEGRLRVDEYEERLETAYAAKTYADLDRLVADLPRPAPELQLVERRPKRGCWCG